MLIILSGENSYERLRYADAIFDEYIKKRGHLGAEIFDFTEKTVPEFIDFSLSKSIFSPVKLVMIKELEPEALKKEDEAAVYEILSKLKDDEATVIIVSTRVLSDHLKKISRDISLYRDFPLHRDQDLRDFIKKEGRRRDIMLSDDDCDNLTLSFGKDVWLLINEIERLSLSREKTRRDSYADTDLFRLVNDFRFGKTRAQKLFALELALSKLGADGSYIFNLLTSFAPKNVRPENWFSLLSDYDVAVKSGRMGYEEALLDISLI